MGEGPRAKEETKEEWGRQFGGLGNYEGQRSNLGGSGKRRAERRGGLEQNGAVECEEAPEVGKQKEKEKTKKMVEKNSRREEKPRVERREGLC